MKAVYGRLLTMAAGLLVTQISVAQAPSGSTGQCKDGTYTSTPTKSGACSGHQGVKVWYASTSSPSTVAPSAVAPNPSTKPSPAVPPKSATSPASSASVPQASGGGPGMVWVNTATNVYHCSGSKYYGKTKQGAYMSEADAKAKGAHADHSHACTR